MFCPERQAKFFEKFSIFREPQWFLIVWESGFHTQTGVCEAPASGATFSLRGNNTDGNILHLFAPAADRGVNSLNAERSYHTRRVWRQYTWASFTVYPQSKTPRHMPRLRSCSSISQCCMVPLLSARNLDYCCSQKVRRTTCPTQTWPDAHHTSPILYGRST